MAAICFHGRGTHTQPQYNTLIVLLSTYLCNLSTCCRLLQLRGGEPPQADYSAKKAIRHYRSVTSQIIMGGAPRAPAESKAFYNPTYTHILCFTVKCVLLRLGMGTGVLRVNIRLKQRGVSVKTVKNDKNG